MASTLFRVLDVLALPLWTYLIYDGFKDLNKTHKVDRSKNLRAFIRLFIGFLGLFADVAFILFDFTLVS